MHDYTPPWYIIIHVHIHLLQPSLSRGKLSSLATNSVRLKKKVVPTLISNRPRRPKLDRPDGSKPDRPDGSKPDRPAVELVAQSSTHVDHSDSSSAQNQLSSHTAVRPVAESIESQESVGNPAACYSHILGRRNNVSLTCCKFTLNTKHICVVTYMYILCFFVIVCL